MNTLHVLLPTPAKAVHAPAFADWLAHGDRLPPRVGGRTAALRARFRFAGDRLPVAVLRHHALAADAGHGAWVAADPAYIRSEATGARLMAWPIRDLALVDALALARTLQPLFGDAGTPLVVDAPAAWCVQAPGGAPPVELTAPADALGADLLACLPAGEAGRSWRHLFTEAQVLLHAHPVNAARVAAGKVPVNAVWLWGDGVLPAAVASDVTVVASDVLLVRGLARAAGVACLPPGEAGAHAADAFGQDGSGLLDLDQHGSEVGMWLPHFRAWLRTRRFGAIELDFRDGTRWRVRHRHRWRFWRRA